MTGRQSRLGSLALLSALYSLHTAFRAGTQRAQVIERVDAGRMAVAPVDLQRVATHHFRALGLQRLLVHREGAGCQSRLQRVMRLIVRSRTSGAGALLAQLAVRIRAHVSVGPLDADRPTFARQFDFVRCQHPNCPHSILISAPTSKFTMLTCAASAAAASRKARP